MVRRGGQARAPRPTPTCARPSTSASTTGARRCGWPPAAPCVDVPGEGNRLTLPAARRRRRHLAVELPARHPDRHDRRPQLVTGNTVVFKPAEQTPGDRLAAGRRRCTARACPTTCWPSCPASARRSGRCWSSTRLVAFVVVHRLEGGRARHHRAGRRRAAGPAAREAGDRRDGRQEPDRRRRRRRPRRGRPGHRRTPPSATPGRSARRRRA